MADDNREDQTRDRSETEHENDPPERGNESETDTTQQDNDDDVAAMRKALAKANREAAANRKRLAEYEDRDKTESQRLSERAEAAEKRAGQAESRLLRLEVAARKGLPAQLAARLQGDTEEELEEDADSLLELVAEKKTRRDPDQGRGNGRTSTDEANMNDWLRRAAGVRVE